MKKRYLKVDGHPDLVRDITTNAVININTEKSERQEYIRKQRIDSREELEQVKNELHNVKMLLQQLLETKSNA